MTGVAVLLALATRGAAAESWLPDPGAPISFSARNIASFGLAVRTSARDPDLIGKASLDPGLCAADDCIGVRADDTGPNERYLAAPGALSSNTDDGEVNFAKGDFTNVVAKWTTSWTIDWDQYRFNLGAILFFDPLNTGFEELRLNQKVRPGPGPGQRVRVRRTRETERDIGYDFELREANAQRSAHLFGLPVDLLIGRYRLPLGESALSVRGTLDFMNPPDVNNLTRPGFKLVELYKPVGMVLAHTHLGLDLRAEGWWQFEWRPLGLPAKGSFFSFFDAGNEVTSDDHVVAPLAKAPDDPRQIQTPANPFLASITATSFNLRRAANREPGTLTRLGQLGVALYWKRPDLLEKGVEFGFLLATYHARIPSVSAYASEASCTRREGNGRHQDAANLAEFSLDCGVPGISRPGVDFEALPVDTTRYVLDYPENVVLLGTSAHAEIWGNYWQADVAFRPNDPVQVDMEDLFFLLNVNRGYRVEVGRRVVVVGGGLVALDAARTAVRLLLTGAERAAEELSRVIGAEVRVALDAAREARRRGALDVSVVSLEQLEEMPAMRSVQGREEMDVTRDEGIAFTPGWGPKRIVGENGRATGIELIRCARVFDEHGRFNPTFVSGSEQVVPADTILLAIGQRSDYSFLRPEDGVQLTPAGLIQVDAKTLGTTAPDVFAGGDGAFPPSLLITAAEHGKRAASSIDGYLTGRRGRPTLHVVAEEQPLDSYRMPEGYERIPRHVPVVPVNRRTGITEVEECYTEAEAMRQADRCLSCHVHPIYDRDLCILCARCADICPENCISFLPVEEIQLSAGDQVTVAALAPADQPNTAFLYAEERCIRCALCAIRCPTGAITMERFRFEESGDVSTQ